jgi:transcriptional regulator with XRE-family HTH domain
MDMKINPARIRQLRESAAWSQEDLAAASGVSLRTVQRVEKDGVAARETQKALAAAFDLSPKDLEQDDPAAEKRDQQLGLGLLILWIGFSWLFNLGWGGALLGVGVIYIGGQIFRVAVQRKMVLWELGVIGLLFAAGGGALLADAEIRVAPVLVIVAGCVTILSNIRR